MVAYACSSTIREAEGGGCHDFKASMGFIMSSRPYLTLQVLKVKSLDTLKVSDLLGSQGYCHSMFFVYFTVLRFH